MLGPAIGGVFSRFGLGVPGYVAAALCLINGIAALVYLPESRHFRERPGWAAGVRAKATGVLERRQACAGGRPL